MIPIQDGVSRLLQMLDPYKVFSLHGISARFLKKTYSPVFHQLLLKVNFHRIGKVLLLLLFTRRAHMLTPAVVIQYH